VSALALCLRMTRAPAMKPTRRARRWVIMVLFGDEFDADERAEVGGGDGLGELYEIGDT
jgi:hypothetical protein